MAAKGLLVLVGVLIVLLCVDWADATARHRIRARLGDGTTTTSTTTKKEQSPKSQQSGSKKSQQAPKQKSSQSSGGGGGGGGDENCFYVIPAGICQNDIEGEQAGYVVAHSSAKHKFLMLDAGTEYAGLIKGEDKYMGAGLVDREHLTSPPPANKALQYTMLMIKNGIQSFLVSSENLASFMGMVITSAEGFHFSIPNERKTIMGTAAVKDAVTKVFNGKLWPNFLVEPNTIEPLKKFAFTEVAQDGNPVDVPGMTNIKVSTYKTVSNGAATSSFLVTKTDSSVPKNELSILYLGDYTESLQPVWAAVAQIVADGKLAAIIMGAPAATGKAEPERLAEELTALAEEVKKKKSTANLKGLNIVPNRFVSYDSAVRDRLVTGMCTKVKDLGVNIVMPQPGTPFQVFAQSANKQPVGSACK